MILEEGVQGMRNMSNRSVLEYMRILSKSTRQIHLNNDFRGGIYRRAKCEKPEFTEVNEDFEHEHND